MKIDFKTQTNRTTKFHTGFNNINICLRDFEMGLETTNWGEREGKEPVITFQIEGHNYFIPLEIFKEKAKVTIKLLAEKYGVA